MPVVDANVIIHGRSEAEFKKALTIPEVIKELESTGASTRGELMDLKTVSPSKKIVEKVNDKAEEINSSTSDTDNKLLALAIEKDQALVTDDKELQNLGLHLEADIEGFLDEPTDQKMTWVLKCSNCGREVKKPPCPLCGSHQVQKKRG